MSKRVVFTAVKNEGPFLLEWIAYHRAIGFDKILIVSNDSDDGTTELLNALDAAGVIHHIYNTIAPTESPHGRAAESANASGLLQDGDWVMWLDADEFLNIHAGDGRVDDLIAAIGDKRGMLINWHSFGDGGNSRFPGRFISADFTGSDARHFHRNRRVKTFFQWRDGATWFIYNPHRPYIAASANYKASDFLNGGGSELSPASDTHRKWAQGKRGEDGASKNSFTTEEDYLWEVAQVNHYTVRTPDMYGLKRHRGRSHAKILSDGRENAVRHDDDFYDQFNRNECADSSILRFEDATTAELSKLMAAPAIAAAHQATVALTEKRIAEMGLGAPTEA